MSRKALLVLAAAAFLGRAPARAATAGEVWNEVFTADEQRILYAIKADPTADAALKAGLQRVVRADAKAFEAEKRRFQAEWLGRIHTFASSYKAGQGQGVKPTAAAASAQVPWLAAVDQKDWGGKLVPALMQKLDPQELAYNIAHLRSLDPEDQKVLTDKLGWAKTFRYSSEAVADEMVKTARETMGKVVSGLASGTPARLATAKQQLAAAEQALASARTAPSDEAAAGASPVFDNARPAPGAPQAPGGSVVDARDTPPAAPPAESRLQPAPPVTGERAGATLPGAPRDEPFEIPAPKTPSKDERTHAAEAKPGIGDTIRGVMKSPIGKGGAGGAVLGAVAGFFLGGPIGALVGLFLGAALGAGAAMAMTREPAPSAQ